MRDYERFNEYLDRLQGDIYPQPTDPGHLEWAIESLQMIPEDVMTVLDVGCGTGFCQDIFLGKKMIYSGITLGIADYKHARYNDRNVLLGDMSYLPWNDEDFHLVFARHALEHSPFPIITLMEWHRVASKYLLLVAPAPDYWNYHGKNHYSVANAQQLWWWLARAGWEIDKRWYLWSDDDSFMKHYLPQEQDRSKVEYPGPPVVVEYRYLCKKVNPKVE